MAYNKDIQNQKQRAEQFEDAMYTMVQQCIDYEDGHRLLSDWDEIESLIEAGRISAQWGLPRYDPVMDGGMGK